MFCTHCKTGSKSLTDTVVQFILFWNKIDLILKKVLTDSTLSISFSILQFKESISCIKQLEILSVLFKRLVCITYQHTCKRFVKTLNALPFYELWEHSILWPLENAQESTLGILDERPAKISLALFAHCFRIFQILY
jgi:hypothetical protein